MGVNYPGKKFYNIGPGYQFTKPFFFITNGLDIRTVHIRHQCWKVLALSCHRCLINTCVEKMNYSKIYNRTLNTRGRIYSHVRPF
jgi:hypothetical protein